MKYGELELTALKDTATITFQKNQKVIHYPGTNMSDTIELGRASTTVTCTLVAKSDSEKNNILAILNDTQELNLEYRDMLFKRVKTGESPRVSSPINGIWHIDATFIALDPKIYSI